MDCTIEQHERLAKKRGVLAAKLESAGGFSLDVQASVDRIQGILDAADMQLYVCLPFMLRDAVVGPIDDPRCEWDPSGVLRIMGLATGRPEELAERILILDHLFSSDRFLKSNWWGKPFRYYAGAVRREARRSLERRRVKDADRLEMDPKGNPRLSRVQPAFRGGITNDPVGGLEDPRLGDLESLVFLFHQATEAAKTPEEQDLLALVALGNNPSEACREVGVDRRAWENLQARIKRRVA